MAESVSHQQSSGISQISAPLTDAEHRAYSRLATKMEAFHNHFKRTWRFLEDACEAEGLPAGLALIDFIYEGLSFCMSLEMHHNIEEQYFFPQLARKMPEFREDSNVHLLEQHRVIHKGLSELNSYLSSCRLLQLQFDFKEMKIKMDSWSSVLREHLDAEVHTLRAENLQKYWTLDEINRIRM